MKQTICMTANTVVNQSVFHFFKLVFTTSVSADHGDHGRWRDPGAERAVRLLQLHGPGALPERELAGPGPGPLHGHPVPRRGVGHRLPAH